MPLSLVVVVVIVVVVEVVVIVRGVYHSVAVVLIFCIVLSFYTGPYCVYPRAQCGSAWEHR